MEESSEQINNNSEGKLFSVSDSFTLPNHHQHDTSHLTPTHTPSRTYGPCFSIVATTTLNDSSVLNFSIPAACGDASCGTSPVVADASSIIDMTKTPPTGKPATQNENKRKIETIAEEPSPKKIQEKGWSQMNSRCEIIKQNPCLIIFSWSIFARIGYIFGPSDLEVYERGVNERIILGEMIMTCCKLLLLNINHSKSFQVF